MSIELGNLRGSDIKGFSYEETCEVVELLEEKLSDTYSIINATEDYDAFRGHAQEIFEKIENNAFPDSVNEERKAALRGRVETVIFNMSLLLRVNLLAQERIEQGVTKVESIKASMENDIKESLEKEKDKIDKLEHSTLSHVLSIMGVFSAIITLIISVVITSSSWLNSAHGASAVVAFIVPNLVTLIAVFVLISLIFFYIHRDTQTAEEKCSKLKKSVAFTFCIVALIICVIASCIFCFAGKDEVINPHIIYILSPGEYRTQYEVITPGSADDSVEEQKQAFFEFTFEDKLYRFEYDESYLHDGNLYFCEKHCTLE